MIKCEGWFKSYPVGQRMYPVLKGLEFEIDTGEFVALMGRSGSGKTTVLNILGLLDHLSAGTYWLAGQAMMGHSSRALAAFRNTFIGFVFQHFFLLPRLNILDNICLPLQYYAGDRDQAYAHCLQLMKRLGIAEFAQQMPAQLSGGQQQRVAICRALACKPKVLLADEPTGALDAQNSEEIMSLFKELNEEDGLTIFMITHDSELAQRSQRVLHLVEGQIKLNAQELGG